MKHLRRKIKYLTLMLLLIIGMSTVSDSYAFWANSIGNGSQVAQGTVQTGTWTQIFPWVSGVTYNTGDLVTYNGLTYRSLRNGNTKVPGANGSASWWTVV